MKRSFLIAAVGFVAGFLISPLYSLAEEDTTVSGMSSITYRGVSGERESSKFQEYREIPDGTSGNVELRYRNKKYYFLELKAKDIAEDDQNLNLNVGQYGKYRIGIIYDQLPHRFAFDARTLYAGVGSGSLILSDQLQTDLQGLSGAALASALQNFFDGAASTDLELFRETGMVNIEVMAFDPIDLRVEVRREERNGTRPFSGTFGFSNTVELPEPIKYETTALRFGLEYARMPVYLNVSYYLSFFRNDINTLTWDNPLRGADSPTSGPSKGLIDLYPENDHQSVSLSGSYSDLPLKSRISAITSWGWMRQDDALVAYTVNPAINSTNVAALVPLGITDASDPSQLPVSKVDAKVNTALYNLQLTSKPLELMHVKTRYRYYVYNNNTGEIQFPGRVNYDTSWVTGTEENLPTGYRKTTAGIDFGFDLFKATTLTLAYTYDKMKRDHREASKTEDDIYEASIDTRPLSWMDFRVSYERSVRDGNYDFTVPFEGVTPNAQLPFLVKYDEADRDRDRIHFVANFYPIETFTVTSSVIYGKDDFEDSPFGLLEDQHQIYSIDADYALTDWFNFNTFYSYERYKNKNNARQWVSTASCIQDGDTTAGECTDPYNAVTLLDSPSNWIAENQDRVNTVGAGLNAALVPKKLDLDLTYSFSKTDGEVELSSQVGANIDVDANRFTPAGFAQVDDITIQTLDAKVKLHFNKGLSLAVGYLWEIFDISDFSDQGFTFVPTTITGAFNGALLMGVLPKDYTASVIYTKLSYRF